MLNFFDRLEEYRKTTGLSTRAFEKKAGISNGLIGRAAKRGDGQLSQDNIVKILETYEDLDADWLLTGRGEMSGSCMIDSKNPTKTTDLEIINYIDFNLDRFEKDERFLRIVEALKSRKFEDRITKEITELKKQIDSISKAAQ
jgi:transcriptional regulator with XRE-family HTH domain